jgi:hypothetical protein
VFPGGGPQGSEKDQWLQYNGEWTVSCSQLIVASEPVIEQDNYKIITSGARYNIGYIKASG